MTRKISETELRHLRNEIDIEDVIQHLEIPWKKRDGYFRFLCPLCKDFNTATNPKTNLARCFRCEENFNPIDIVMKIERLSFLNAVHHLRRHHEESTSGTSPP